MTRDGLLMVGGSSGKKVTYKACLGHFDSEVIALKRASHI